MEQLVQFRQNPYRKKSKKSLKELRSLSSKRSLESSILNIANTYSNAERIYFPVRLDQTTRLYCTPEYFNYQSTDLAKGLLSFSKPGIIYKHDIEAIHYFKSFGAILFDSNLSKKSLINRVKWIDNNKDILLNFRNNDVINKAESKACFVSFSHVLIMNDILNT